MERLQKVMAKSGVCSRRKAEQYILDGRVKVNGIVCTELGTKVDGNDQVEVDGQIIEREDYVYYLLKNRKVVFVPFRMNMIVKRF